MTFKSGKQRRAEILDARQKTLSRKAQKALDKGAANLNKTGVNSSLFIPAQEWFGFPPEFVARGFYEDKPFRCIDCGAESVWTAQRQKWWYEVAHGHLFSTAVRCAACRAKQRQQRDAARQKSQAGLLCKQTKLEQQT